MRLPALCLAPLLCGLLALPLAAEETGAVVPQAQAEISLSFAPVVKRATPAVVNIYASRTVPGRVSPFAADPFFADMFRNLGATQPRVENSLGSGVIVSADGYVVSNYHVVGQADAIRVVLGDRREFEAKVVLGDRQADLAVLKLEGASGLPVLPLRASNDVEVGDLVLAIGNPFGVGQTVSQGIVSGLARSAGAMGEGRGYYIQTDAAINPGNSGGALVDTAGRLVGINTSILSRGGGSNGIGFAIPADLVGQFVAQAEAGSSRFRTPWAGLEGKAVDAELAEALGMALPEGLAVSRLDPASSLARAGLATSDVILSIDGAPVNSPAELDYRLSIAGIGATVEVERLRRGVRTLLPVTLEAAPETPPRAPLTLGEGSPLDGLAAVTLNPAVIAEQGLPGGSTGVLVTDPGPLEGWNGLRKGDVITAINGREVSDTATLRQAARARQRNWQVEIARNGQPLMLRFRS